MDLVELVNRRPMYLGIETITRCNAKCAFCAYPVSTRPNTVMDAWLWQKACRDYAEIGGGALSLSPLTGDVLLDPLLSDRLVTARQYWGISHIQFFTNGISWRKQGRSNQSKILSLTSKIIVSIGGLDAESYRTHFGVNAFNIVRQSVADMIALRAHEGHQCRIVLQFRVVRGGVDLLADPRLQAFTDMGPDRILVDDSYHNWGNLFVGDQVPQGLNMIDPGDWNETKRHPCYVYYVAPMVLADGRVTVCGCANPDGRELIIGHLSNETLREIWNGRAYRDYLRSFYRRSPPSICRTCSYYQDGDAFIRDPRLAAFEIGQTPWEYVGDE